ncbi:hypothetical protein L195_g001396 [Trifolium pratense]|uniref:DUF659 domain-containing protein n=1 Tax=Trifolium pratense TaxID=57577 RepID=A0A2K3NPK8_TRIPR|nr:hypothetical protein L195_g001396 [Trifolium pratense]
MIDDIVEQVGEDNVLQVVTDNEANYKAAGVCGEDVVYCIRGDFPLIRVLRMVDSDEKPAMGYIYEEME